MESDSYEETLKAFYQIDISDEPRKRAPLLTHRQTKHVDFEQYVKENCKNKFQILNRETFHQIKKPIVIFFNHFREKCAYHTNWLDSIYQLASNYGERIEFIAADMYDIDIIYPGRNPILFFDRLQQTEKASTEIFAIDEKKRIYKHSPHNIAQNIIDLFKYLLNGSLFPSKPLMPTNDTNLFKECNTDNFEEVVLKSTKNIFLVVSSDEFLECYVEPNYENVALALKDYNIDIVYIDGDLNYVPFELNVTTHPILYFLPHYDKKNFLPYDDIRKEQLIIDYLKNIIDNPDIYKAKLKDYETSLLCKKLEVPKDFQIDFKDLQQFLQQNYRYSMEVFKRSQFERNRDDLFVIFMDFQGKCMQHHVEWFNKLYQIAENRYHNARFVIADFKDINVINTRWQPKDIIEATQGKPKIYAKDQLQHTYEFGTFDSIPKLYYFTESIQYKKYLYSQLYVDNDKLQAVDKWAARFIHYHLKWPENHIFITFYSSTDEKSKILLDILEEIAHDVKDLELNVKVVIFDVELNYVDLEYAQTNYPAQYFISRNNVKINKLYNGNCLDKEETLNFIQSNIPVPLPVPPIKLGKRKNNSNASSKKKRKKRRK